MDINKIYNESCFDIMSTFPDKSIDLIFSDLPYGTVELKWDKVLDIDLLFSEYRRIVKDEGCIAIMMAYPNVVDLLYKNKDILKYDIIWGKPNKTNFANAKNKPMRQHENIFIFSKAGTANGSKIKMKYFPQGLIPFNKPSKAGNTREKQSFMGIRNNYDQTGYIQEFTNYPTTIFTTSKMETGLHPTQKPVDLVEYVIKTFTKEGDIVYDSCSGSGTTAIACINTNRNFICSEIDKEYFDVSAQRVENRWNEKLISERNTELVMALQVEE